MKINLFFVLFFFSLFSFSASGQTASDLEKKYGPPTNVYEIRPGVLLTAKYTVGGQVCEMTLERRHRVELGFDLSDTLTDQLVKEIIDELLPASERGEKVKSYGWSMNLGLTLQTNYSYENVEIISAGTRSTKNMVVLIKWKNRACK